MRVKGSFLRGRSVTVVLAAIGALALAGAASADKEKIQFTAAGQSAARGAVLRRADLGTASGWTGGSIKPDISGTMPCSTFHPKQSDLTLIGAAETRWKNTGLQFDSEAQVLETPAMVKLDWQRTVLDPRVIPCLRTGLSGALGPSTKLVSFKQIAFPKIATYTHAYRALVDVTSGATTVRVLLDVVLVGRGRTEITLTTTAPAAAAASIRTAELRLARLFVARAT